MVLDIGEPLAPQRWNPKFLRKSGSRQLLARGLAAGDEIFWRDADCDLVFWPDVSNHVTDEQSKAVFVRILDLSPPASQSGALCPLLPWVPLEFEGLKTFEVEPEDHPNAKYDHA